MAGRSDRDRILLIIGLIAVVIALVLFVRENAQTVRVDFVVGTIETDLGLAVLLSIAVGFVAGYMAGR